MTSRDFEIRSQEERDLIALQERFGTKNWTSEWVTRYVRSQERIADLLEELVGKMKW